MSGSVSRIVLKRNLVPFGCWRTAWRAFATDRGSGHIDEWFASIVRPASFYEANAVAGLKRKMYFYNIDLQGRVFLEDILPKNIATCIKNKDFLDFFVGRIRRVRDGECELLAMMGVQDDCYPFVSPCGRELNFVRPADSPIVFHTLDMDEFSVPETLVFAGSLEQPFHPDQLAISRRSGRLYHEFGPWSGPNDPPPARFLAQSSLPESSSSDYGLVRSSVAVALSEHIVPGVEKEGYSGLKFVCPGRGERFPIPWLPEASEPGPWSMPLAENCNQ